MWVNGNTKQARNLWINWLVDEFHKHCSTPKSKGGMFQGSVHQYALQYIHDNKQKYWLDPSEISRPNIKKGANLILASNVFDSLFITIRSKFSLLAVSTMD